MDIMMGAVDASWGDWVMIYRSVRLSTTSMDEWETCIVFDFWWWGCRKLLE